MEDNRTAIIDSEDKRQYLGFIQDVIKRMAGNSASLKAWLAPILTLVFALGAVKTSVLVFVAGLIVTVAFWMMDAQYLHLERAYRRLYGKAVDGDTRLYDLDPSPYDNGVCDYLNALFSWSTAGYYLVLIVAGIGVCLFVI